MAESKIVFPESAAKFHCIGGACEDNCCRARSWRITVDDMTYKKYEALSGEFGAKLLDSITGSEGDRYFKPWDSGRCPFQRQDMLCEIVIRLGEDYLCHTCEIYPRALVKFNGNAEVSLSLSCPEAVRLLLFDRAGIKFGETPRNEDAPIETNGAEAAAFRIRALLFGIISYKKYTLMDKIAYMGLLFRSLDRLPTGDAFPAAAEETITMYHENLYTPGILDEIHETRTKAGKAVRYRMLVKLVWIITAVIFKSKDNNPVDTLNTKLYERLENLSEMLGTAELIMLVPEAYDRVIVPYVNKNAYIFENYLFYMVYFTRFPNGISDYDAAYKEFIGEFIMLLVFAAGLYRNKKNIRDWEIVNVVYLFHRTVSHNDTIRKRLTEFLNGIGSMGEFLSLFGKLK